MYHALVEARVPFDLVHEAFLTPETLDRYALVVLANAAALSDAQCEALRAYVGRGGGLLATFESSRYDEHGRRRPDFGLGDLFGVRDAGGVDGPMKNSYLTLEGEAGARHEVLHGLDDAPRVINGVWRVRVTPVDGARAAAPADAGAVLSRPADGRRLPAPGAHRHARALPARARPRSRRLLPLGHRSDVLGGAEPGSRRA